MLLTIGASIAVALLAGACGTEKIGVSSSSPLYAGAVLFNQRCAGCHTLSYAVANGSAANVRSAQYNNGPNFNIRCERPANRVLYAIENGGFSGAIMPQNVVVGADAVKVAEFVATYSGRQAPQVPGVVPCAQESLGTVALPAVQAAATATSSTTSTATPRAEVTKPAAGAKKK